MNKVLLLLCVLILCFMGNVHGGGRKRRRKTIEEISESSISTIVEANAYVAVLFHDASRISAKALHDLELIHEDSEKLGIIWYRIQLESNAVTGFSTSDINDYPCHVVLYRKTEAIMFGGKPDRQTLVFQWLITEMYCHMDQPLSLQMIQFEVLIRSFRNFVMILEPHNLVQELTLKTDICNNLESVLVTSSADEMIQQYLSLDFNPSVINMVHGIPVPFEGDSTDLTSVEAWVRETAKDDILSVGERELDKILRRENEVMVLFMGGPNEGNDIHPKLNSSIGIFEMSYDLPTIRVKDLKISKSYGLKNLPQILLFQNGKPRRFDKIPLNSPNVINVIEEWIVETLDRKEKKVIKSISSSAFKNSPDEFRNILLKEHKDSIRILSKEYARLQKENKALRSIIKAGQKALSSDIVDPPSTVSQTSGKALTAECGDCLSSVGQAVWTCGTLDILDSWWPNDAPNCFKKEIQAITNASNDVLGGESLKNDDTGSTVKLSTPGSKRSTRHIEL
ncbi:unnamed protein product [Lepeophtheirus salmonis]|uniref:(salmon louse) hypothetical protein n=1 Tax=Lepeophtheirus salmonis TaxID=72036 RepID=A0A7R8H0S4_LEPSM|nr:unnamed protein product [Lepeophtheirus salmonis]CAF2796658.1 unnamed protein product [Lepeophtheirus salmonis]